MSDFLDEIREREQEATAPGMLAAVAGAVLAVWRGWRAPQPEPVATDGDPKEQS